MKTKHLIGAFLCALSSFVYSQAQPKAFLDWATTSGTQYFYYKSVTKTDSYGNIIVAGATMNNGFPDILVAKYNSSGVQLWIQQYAGTATNGVDFAGGLYVTDTHVYITGAISNNTVTPETDLVTMKLASSTGSVVWSATYNGAGNFHDAGKNIIVDGSGNVFVSGATYNASLNTDFIALRYNSSGVQQWAKVWDYAGGDDASYRVATSGSNLNTIGAVTTATANVYKMATLRLAQSTGSLLSTSIGTAVTTTSVDVVCDMAIDETSGDVIIAGSNNVPGQGTNFYVQKLNSATLASAWTYTYNGAASQNDVIKAVQMDASGNVYVAGYTSTSALGRELTIIKLNSSGTHQWTQTSGFTGDDEINDLVLDNSGNVYVTGYRASDINLADYYTAKYNSSGTKQWEMTFDGIHRDDKATNITLDSLNNVIVNGQVESGPGNFTFATLRYIQSDAITPTDYNLETPSNNFMYFPNKGQLIGTNDTLVPDVKFYTHNTYPQFYFKKNSMSMVFSKVDTLVATTDTLHRIDMTLDNVRNGSKTYPLDEQKDGYLNYYLAHTDSNGVTGVFGNQRLITKDIYTNIDLMYSSNQNGIKYYFIVKPGGNPADIQLTFTGASSFSLNGTSNELSINSSIGSLTYDRPTAYQLTAGNATVAVTGWTPDWQTNGAANKYTFNLGAYTSSLTLIIEVDQGNTPYSPLTPINDIDWSTFYGGSVYDEFSDVFTDKIGNIILSGTTYSNDFPIIGINAQPYGGGGEAAIVRLNKNSVRKWSTYYGSSSGNNAESGVIDTLSNYYITGRSSGTVFFPAIQPPSAFVDNTFNGDQDTYICKFDSLGKLRWTTLYGSSGIERPFKINIDKNNNLFIVGSHNNFGTFPTVPKINAYNSNIGRGFILKFNPQLQLEWATKFGNKSTNGDIFSIEFDHINDFYITGRTFDSLNTVFLNGASNDTTFFNSANNLDAFLAGFKANQDTIFWSRYIGGNNFEDGYELKCIGRELYLTGITSSSNFPYKYSGKQYIDTATSGTMNGFIMKFSTLNKKLLWSTVLKSEIYGVGKDKLGNFITTGKASNSLPTVQHFGSYWQPSSYGLADAFVAIFDNYDSLIYSTYVGGADNDIYTGTAFFNDYVYFTGYSKSGQNSATIFPLADLGGTPPAWWQPTINNTNGDYTATATRFNFSATLYVGIKELQILHNNSALASVYPNPSSDFVSLKFKKTINEEILVELYDILGRNLYLKSFNNIIEDQIEYLDLGNFASGVYLIKISSIKQQECIKIIKER